MVKKKRTRKMFYVRSYIRKGRRVKAHYRSRSRKKRR